MLVYNVYVAHAQSNTETWRAALIFLALAKTALLMFSVFSFCECLLLGLHDGVCVSEACHCTLLTSLRTPPPIWTQTQANC